MNAGSIPWGLQAVSHGSYMRHPLGVTRGVPWGLQCHSKHVFVHCTPPSPSTGETFARRTHAHQHQQRVPFLVMMARVCLTRNRRPSHLKQAPLWLGTATIRSKSSALHWSGRWSRSVAPPGPEAGACMTSTTFSTSCRTCARPMGTRLKRHSGRRRTGTYRVTREERNTIHTRSTLQPNQFMGI